MGTSQISLLYYMACNSAQIINKPSIKTGPNKALIMTGGLMHTYSTSFACSCPQKGFLCLTAACLLPSFVTFFVLLNGESMRLQALSGYVNAALQARRCAGPCKSTVKLPIHMPEALRSERALSQRLRLAPGANCYTFASHYRMLTPCPPSMNTDRGALQDYCMSSWLLQAHDMSPILAWFGPMKAP